MIIYVCSLLPFLNLQIPHHSYTKYRTKSRKGWKDLVEKVRFEQALNAQHILAGDMEKGVQVGTEEARVGV